MTTPQTYEPIKPTRCQLSMTGESTLLAADVSGREYTCGSMKFNSLTDAKSYAKTASLVHGKDKITVEFEGQVLATFYQGKEQK